MFLAVMDLGSNSFKMTVAEWKPIVGSKSGPFNILHKERHPIQLGASVFSTGSISPSDFKEALLTLQKMQVRLRDFPSPILHIVGTSAIREARNGKLFVATVKKTLGLNIEVISGTREAHLIARGLTLEFPKMRRGLLIDIGGGSTEIATFGNTWKKSVGFSLSLGSVRLATKHFNKRKLTPLPSLKKQIKAQLRFAKPKDVQLFVGSAGTIQSLGAILAKNPKQPRIQLDRLKAWIEKNYFLSPKLLEKKYKVQPSRARVIVPGAVLLSQLMENLGTQDIAVTAMSLRDGVLVELVRKWKHKNNLENSVVKISTLPFKHRRLIRNLKALALKFQIDFAHSSHVAKLAYSLYTQMNVLKGTAPLEEEERCLLAAAYLHDVGTIVSESAHHKHSAYILKNLKIEGFTSLDSKKAALVALFHRKEEPSKKDPLPLGIGGLHAEQVRKLSAILRLVDGLDQDHTQSIASLKLSLSKKEALLELYKTKAISMDMNYFRDKAAYFEELFGIKVVSYFSSVRA